MKRWVALIAVMVLVWVLSILIMGVGQLELIRSVFTGAFGSLDGFAGTLKEMTPLLGCGVAVYLALRAGMFNIGVEGQFMVGALAAAAVGLKVPGGLGIGLGLLAGALFGAFWALPAAWIRAFRGGHEVISTIMLNEVARHISTALLSGPMKDPNSQSESTATLTSTLPPIVNQPMISAALPITVVLLLMMAFWLRKTVKGFTLEMTGASVTVAKSAGVPVPWVLFNSLISSGAIAGLCGALHVLAIEHRVYSGFSSGFGFDALGVALLAGSQPWAMLGSAFAFGALKQGFSTAGVMLSVPKGLSTLLLGMAILALGVYQSRKKEVKPS